MADQRTTDAATTPQPVLDAIAGMGRTDFAGFESLDHGAAFVAFFGSDQGLRSYGQSSLVSSRKGMGILILPDGRIPRDAEAQGLYQRHNARA
jgi:hypothetical protein